MGLVGSRKGTIDGPGGGIGDRQPDEIDDLLLRGDELDARRGALAPGRRGGEIEQHQIVGAPPRRHEHQAFLGFGREPHPRRGRGEFPVGLGDPEAARPVAGTLQGFQERQRARRGDVGGGAAGHERKRQLEAPRDEIGRRVRRGAWRHWGQAPLRERG